MWPGCSRSKHPLVKTTRFPLRFAGANRRITSSSFITAECKGSPCSRTAGSAPNCVKFKSIMPLPKRPAAAGGGYEARPHLASAGRNGPAGGGSAAGISAVARLRTAPRGGRDFRLPRGHDHCAEARGRAGGEYRRGGAVPRAIRKQIHHDVSGAEFRGLGADRLRAGLAGARPDGGAIYGAGGAGLCEFAAARAIRTRADSAGSHDSGGAFDGRRDRVARGAGVSSCRSDRHFACADASRARRCTGESSFS